MARRVSGVGLVVLALAVSACSTGAGTAPSGSPTTTAAWTSPAPIQSTPSSEEISVYGISCARESSCVAVDENGVAHTWQAGRWSNAQSVSAGGSLTSVSCPLATRCVAVSAGGSSSTYDGRSWSPASPVGPAASYRVSCPTTDFCAAVGASGTPGGPNTVATFDGNSWSTKALPASSSVSDRLFDVSCPTPSFCVAIDLDGSALTYDGTTWSHTRGPAMQRATSISCPLRSFCMAVGAGGYSTYDGKGWSVPKAVPGFQSAFVPDVSCASSDSCTMIGLNGESSRWNHGTWSAPVSVFSGEFLGTVAISCPTVRFCMAVNSRGTEAHT